MNCEPFLPKCKAECCGPCPIPVALFEANRHRVARAPAHEVLDEGGNTHAIDAHGMCVFRQDDFHCAIYQDRPEVCRLFGTGCHPLMVCPWQAPDGRERYRAERRQVERMVGPHLDKALQRLSARRVTA